MADKLSLTDITNLRNEQSALGTLTANFRAIETAMDKTLSRDGTSPNPMDADLDMDSNRIINLPDATTAQEPVTLSQFETGVASSGAAPSTPSYVVLGTSTGLSAERVLTAGANISLVDGGPGSTITISASASGTIGGSTGASDNRLLRSDGVGGATIQNSPVTVDDSGNASGFGTIASGADTITSTSASALAVGRQGATDPVLKINAATASVVTGIEIIGAAAGSRVQVSAISSGTNEGLSIDAKGSGTVRLGATSTGQIEFSRNAVPTANDGSALGTTSLGWADLHLATGGVINWANSSGRITHSASAGARRWDFNATTSGADITLGYTGTHTFTTSTVGYGVLNQLGATFDTGSGGSTWQHYYSQNLINVQNSVTAGSVVAYHVQNGTFGSAPTGTITDQIVFHVDQCTGQHSGSASISITSNYGLKIDNQGSYSGGSGTISIGTAYALKISDQTGATTNYAIHTSAGRIQFFGGTAVPAGGTAGVGVCMSSTTNLGVFFGSGAPSLSAAQGSLYIRTDGSSTSTRLYVNTNGSTTWTNVTTAA